MAAIDISDLVILAVIAAIIYYFWFRVRCHCTASRVIYHITCMPSFHPSFGLTPRLSSVPVLHYKRSQEEAKPVNVAPTKVVVASGAPDPNLKEYTREELRQYDGKEGRPIYIGICNKVFDCTAGAEFYGPGGNYENFAGRDISRAAGKFSTEERYLADPRIDTLTLAELDSMKHFFNVIGGKYKLIGRMKRLPPSTETTTEPTTATIAAESDNKKND